MSVKFDIKYNVTNRFQFTLIKYDINKYLVNMITLCRVVLASVAMLLLLSVIRFSRSRLQAVTAAGCFMATCVGTKNM